MTLAPTTIALIERGPAGIIRDSHRRVYDRIVAAARAGQGCPTNSELCEATGAASASSISAAVRSLEKRGLISVTRYGVGRDVSLPALGLSCAPWQGNREIHWRHRPGHIRIAHNPVPRAKSIAAEEDRVDEDHLPPAVYRDPCPRCGTRMDIGCGHQPIRIGMGAFA